ncbi:cobalt transporter [Herbaspirillum sp. DW155]|uniref:cobalt transporter n=1 Tax=Herbaspirillum sp. DW155 TaxID=3095609 RepID=UPI00308E2265|nr:cobalt transporter [Herbaspirillum sp. DW155]
MRVLVLFLALLLPLQLSWAAVASYCQPQKESASHPGHPGHHTHAAPASAQLDAGDSGNDDTSKGDKDFACGLCHLSSLKSVQWNRPDMAERTGTCRDVFCTIAPAPDSHIADGPDKPNWLLAA